MRTFAESSDLTVLTGMTVRTAFVVPKNEMSSKKAAQQLELAEATLYASTSALNSTIDEAIGALAASLDSTLKSNKYHFKKLSSGVEPFLEEALRAHTMEEELANEQRRRRAIEKHATLVDQTAAALRRRIETLEGTLEKHGILVTHEKGSQAEAKAKTKRRIKRGDEGAGTVRASPPPRPKDTVKSLAMGLYGRTMTTR